MNVYGRNTPRAGEMLPGSPTFDTVEAAEAAARSRSEGTVEGSPSPSFADFSQRIMATLPKWEAGRAEVSEGLRQSAAAQRPLIESVQQQAQQPLPTPPEAPTITQPPSLGLRPYLAPVMGEAPEAS